MRSSDSEKEKRKTSERNGDASRNTKRETRAKVRVDVTTCVIYDPSMPTVWTSALWSVVDGSSGCYQSQGTSIATRPRRARTLLVNARCGYSASPVKPDEIGISFSLPFSLFYNWSSTYLAAAFEPYPYRRLSVPASHNLDLCQRFQTKHSALFGQRARNSLSSVNFDFLCRQESRGTDREAETSGTSGCRTWSETDGHLFSSYPAR